MTLEEIRAIDREWLSASEVAGVLGCDPQGLRVWARQRPEQLGFPVVVLEHRIKIPRRAFLAYMTGKEA